MSDHYKLVLSALSGFTHDQQIVFRCETGKSASTRTSDWRGLVRPGTSLPRDTIELDLPFRITAERRHDCR